MVGWPTPMAGTPAQNGNNAAGNNESSRKTVELASWPTPTAQDHFSANATANRKDPNAKFNSGTTLTDAARFASWATPTARDWKDGATTLENTPVNSLLGRQVLGANSSGSPAPTEKRGQLNPAFSRWLMGYNLVWCDAEILRPLPFRRF